MDTRQLITRNYQWTMDNEEWITGNCVLNGDDHRCGYHHCGCRRHCHRCSCDLRHHCGCCRHRSCGCFHYCCCHCKKVCCGSCHCCSMSVWVEKNLTMKSCHCSCLMKSCCHRCNRHDGPNETSDLRWCLCASDQYRSDAYRYHCGANRCCCRIVSCHRDDGCLTTHDLLMRQHRGCRGLLHTYCCDG